MERERERCSFALRIFLAMRVHMLHASTTRHRPPFLWEDICNTSPQSIHFFIAYAIRLSFIVCFILASHAFCLRIYVLRASYHISSKLQSLSCTLRLIVPLTHQLFAKQCLVSSSLYSHQSYQSCYRANQTQTHRFLSYDFDFIFV